MTALALLLAFAPATLAGSVYDAVANFSLASNPNGTWSYLYEAPGSGPSLMTQSGTYPGVPGVILWSDGLPVPDIAYLTKNTTGSTATYLTIVQPTNLLNMDPQSYTDIIRWTAPSAGVWSIAGIFQGIDIDQHSHPVEIVENGSTVLLSPTTISAYGQVITFSDTVTLATGNTLDFIVSTGPTSFSNLSTGFDVTIQSVPEPSSLLLGVLAILGAGTVAGLHRGNHSAGLRSPGPG
jgi:hypothetical protein